ASCGAALDDVAPLAAAAAIASGTCMVLRILPQAESTASTLAGRGGSFFAAGSASIRRSAASDRCRLLTHQESVTLTPADVGWPAKTSTPARASMAMLRGSAVAG